jgi:murein DD-endopeptidase MepM/ murein hydrolase activator NlpD
MSRRRTPAPTALRLLRRLTGTSHSRRRNSGRKSRSLYVAGTPHRTRGGGKASATLWRKHRAAVGLTLFLGVLVAVNLYVLYYRHDTSVPALLELASAGRRAALSTHARLIGPPGTPPVPMRSPRRAGNTPPLPDYPRIVEIPLKVGDSVPAVLRSHAVSGPLADELQGSLRSLLDPGGIGAGQRFTLYYDLDDRLAALDYRLTDSSAFHLERVATGSTERFVSSRQEQALSQELVSLTLRIERDGDFSGAVTRAGEHLTLAARLAEVFACETSAFTDTQTGDRFRFLVEKQTLGGNFYRYGRLLAAEYLPAPRAPRPGATPAPASERRADRPLRAFLGPHAQNTLPAAGAAPGAAVHYYTESGDSLARALCRVPLLYGKAPGGLADPLAARPVTHVERGRFGTTYAAPVGTPVVAAGAGKVTSIVRGRGPNGPTGNTVIVSHPGGVETIYQNLGRLARGLTEGQPVRLRQIIGHVGQVNPRSVSPTRARPPRPHLYFTLRVAGKQVDPAKHKTPREPGLPAAQRPAFAEQVAEVMARLAESAPPPVTSRVASRPTARPL